MGQISDAREKLVSSAIELMHARSYANVGVQELCKHADVNKGSFYHFFPSKVDLTLTALDRQWEALRTSILEPAFARDVTPLKRLKRFVRLMYEKQCAATAASGQVYGCPFGNLGVELSTQEEPIRRKIAQIFNHLASYFEAVLRDAVAAGEIPAQDVRATAQMLVAYLEGISLMAKARNDMEAAKPLSEGISRLLGMKPNSVSFRISPGR